MPNRFPCNRCLLRKDRKSAGGGFSHCPKKRPCSWFPSSHYYRWIFLAYTSRWRPFCRYRGFHSNMPARHNCCHYILRQGHRCFPRRKFLRCIRCQMKPVWRANNPNGGLNKDLSRKFDMKEKGRREKRRQRTVEHENMGAEITSARYTIHIDVDQFTMTPLRYLNRYDIPSYRLVCLEMLIMFVSLSSCQAKVLILSIGMSTHPKLPQIVESVRYFKKFFSELIENVS